MEETIRWVPVSEPPDDEITVLLWGEDNGDPQVCTGHKMGNFFLDEDGFACDPTHWADMPEGPKE